MLTPLPELEGGQLLQAWQPRSIHDVRDVARAVSAQLLERGCTPPSGPFRLGTNQIPSSARAHRSMPLEQRSLLHRQVRAEATVRCAGLQRAQVATRQEMPNLADPANV
jgi:hypothetical protein